LFSRFLFAKLQLDILWNCLNSHDVSTTLADLPEGLDATWVRLLRDIDTAQPNVNRDKIRRILQWLVAAARPLTVDELQEAITIEEGQTQRNKAEIGDPQDLVNLCGPLVRFNRENNELSLAHFSLKEFLVSGKLLETDNNNTRRYNIHPPDADLYLAKASLTYLSFHGLARSYRTLEELAEVRRNYRFLDYATLYGGTHVGRVGNAEPALISLLNGLFAREISHQELPAPQNETELPVLKMTISMFLPPIESEYASPGRGVVSFMESDYPPDCVLFLLQETVKSTENRPNCTSWLQLFRILSDLTRKDHPANITPLYYASLFGWTSGVERILELNKGRASTSDLNHALRAAAMGNHCDIIKRLHDAGAQVKGNNGVLGSALQSAAFCGSAEAVKALLAVGASAEERHDFYRPGGTVGSALQGAAIKGDATLVKLLLEHGADVNSNRGWLGTPLQAVLERGMEEMAMLLIQSPGFDGSVTGGYYGSALRLVCQHTDPMTGRILRAMLDRNAPSNQRLGVYGSLLEIASHCGSLENVLLLLDYGATVDTSIGQLGNAVHAASMSGDERIVKELLDRGADPMFSGFWLGRDYASGHMPEQSEHGKTLILREGDGFIAYGHSGWDRAFFAPAFKAAKRIKNVNHNKICLLFENEPTHRNGHLGNPLQAAAFRGYSGVLRLLIERGADVNVRSGFFGTALQAAASQGHTDAVNVLLENGANPQIAAAGHYGSAVAATVALNFGDILQTLLDKGADLFATDEHGWNAVAWGVLYRRDALGMIDLSNETQPAMECLIPSLWSMTNKSPKLYIDESGNGVHFQGKPATSSPLTIQTTLILEQHLT
jgi:ankyrin repeat protein